MAAAILDVNSLPTRTPLLILDLQAMDGHVARALRACTELGNNRVHPLSLNQLLQGPSWTRSVTSLICE